MESSLTRQTWLVCNSSSGIAWNELDHAALNFVLSLLPYSGHLGSPVGRSSVVVKLPTMECTLSLLSSYLIVDRDSANQPMQHALKKCESASTFLCLSGDENHYFEAGLHCIQCLEFILLKVWWRLMDCEGLAGKLSPHRCHCYEASPPSVFDCVLYIQIHSR